MRPRFGRPEPVRHEIVQTNLSPEESAFPDVDGRNAFQALPGATTPMHCTSQKIVEGMEPGEMVPLTLGTDEGKPEEKYFHFIVKRRIYT
jgi:hypothetical protein